MSSRDSTCTPQPAAAAAAEDELVLNHGGILNTRTGEETYNLPWSQVEEEEEEEDDAVDGAQPPETDEEVIAAYEAAHDHMAAAAPDAPGVPVRTLRSARVVSTGATHTGELVPYMTVEFAGAPGVVRLPFGHVRVCHLDVVRFVEITRPGVAPTYEFVRVEADPDGRQGAIDTEIAERCATATHAELRELYTRRQACASEYWRIAREGR